MDSLMQETLDNYIQRRFRPGIFTYSMLAGDLYTAVRTADIVNRKRIYELARYIEETLPSESYGSPEAVKAWLRDS